MIILLPAGVRVGDNMKKFLSLIMAISAIICFSGASFAFDFEGLYENYQAIYVPSTNSWTTGECPEGGIILTKKLSTDSGNYSEFYFSNNKPAFIIDSTFEFIKNGHLVSVNNDDLKYNEVIVNNGKFQKIPLAVEDLQDMFPEAEIIKISDFIDNQITIKKGLRQKVILLVNDTENSYYEYSYTPSNVRTVNITGLLTLRTPGKVIFSHGGDEEGQLIINVKL